MANHPIIQRDATGWEQLPSRWPDCIRRVMAARGIQTESDLFYALKDLPKPQQMLGMDAAVKLLYQALEQQWRVMIVADFDSDGATSCALAIRGLQALGLAQVDFIVPNRFIHGYGLTPTLVEDIPTDQQPDLLITVDNGIASIEGVKAAQQRGMKVLVTDHHLPGELVPEADAIVNPNQHGDEFPSKCLAGVGVCFYLLLGLRQFLREQHWFSQQRLNEPKVSDWLDLVALGTVADVVPLDRINRTLVDMGIQRMRHGAACAGIQALIAIAGRDHRQLSSADLGFSVAPRLNAAGRMEDMRLGIHLLLETDPIKAREMALMLDQINLERRAVEQSMQQDALMMLDKLALDDDADNHGVCLFDPDWHQGVIGLLASRIKEKLHRPVVAFAPGDTGELKGSARSITGIHIRDMLAYIDSHYPGIILKFGGHAMAAGMTIAQEQFDAFCQAFETTLALHTEAALYQRQLVSDGELPHQELTLALAEQLPTIAPWGQTFEEPRFHGIFHLNDWRLVGQEANHLRLNLALNDGRQITAMVFYQDKPDWLASGQPVLLRYRLAMNEFRSTRSIQFLVDNLLPVDA